MRHARRQQTGARSNILRASGSVGPWGHASSRAAIAESLASLAKRRTRHRLEKKSKRLFTSMLLFLNVLLCALPKPTASFVFATTGRQRTSWVSPFWATTVLDTSIEDSSISQMPFLRWKMKDSEWQLQTAIVRYQRGHQIIDLHAQVHFADKDYYDYYQSLNNTAVLYELLVDEHLLTTDEGKGRQRRLRTVQAGQHAAASPITASLQDQRTAGAYGWECQANVLNYTQPHWIHADMTRQEFMAATAVVVESTDNTHLLWRSSRWPEAATEAATALLVGPPIVTPTSPTNYRQQVHQTLTGILRTILWLTVPAPEVSILLVDWSALFVSNKQLQISPTVYAVLQAILAGHWSSIRPLLFGQVLMQSSIDDHQHVVVARNRHAMSILQDCLVQYDNMAVLYGSRHCPDLQRRLQVLGFGAIRTQWRTAWTITIARHHPSSSAVTTTVASSLGMAYLAMGGLDWIGTHQDVLNAMTQQHWDDGCVYVVAYLVRHVLLYVAISKFVVNWK